MSRRPFIVEACVISNERLYQSEGGEPTAWVVIDARTDDVIAVRLDEADARQYAHRLNRRRPA